MESSRYPKKKSAKDGYSPRTNPKEEAFNFGAGDLSPDNLMQSGNPNLGRIWMETNNLKLMAELDDPFDELLMLADGVGHAISAALGRTSGGYKLEDEEVPGDAEGEFIKARGGRDRDLLKGGTTSWPSTLCRRPASPAWWRR